MDIINELNSIEKKDIGDLSAVYYNKIAPSTKETNYLSTTTGWVYACCSVIADEVAKTQLKLYKRKGDQTEEVLEHPILDLINKANNFTTKFDLFWLTSQYLELSGEAPWFIEKKGDMPIGIYLLRPDKISIKAGTGDRFVDGYTFRNDRGKEIPIDVDELVFIKNPSTTNQFRGMGTLQAASRVVDIEAFSEDYNKNYFYNAAMPSMFFKTEQKLTEDTKKRFRRQLDQNFKGVKNAHKFLILEAGLDAKPLQLSQKDMEFINQLHWTRDKILGIFRVPRTSLGITDDVNRANAEATDYVFAKRTIQPKIERFIQQLNEFLVPMFPDGQELWIGYESPIPEDVVSKLEYYKTGLMNGFLTINEVREMENLEDIGDKGDQIFLPTNLLPVDAVESPEKILYNIKTRNKEATKNYTKETIKETIKDSVKAVENDVKQMVKEEESRRDKIIMQWSKEKQIKAFKKKKKRAIDYEERFAIAVRKQFKDQLDSILKHKQKIVEREWKIDVDREKAIWFRVFMPIIGDIVKSEGQEVLDSIVADMTFTSRTETAQRFINDKTMKMSWEVNKVTDKKIRKLLADNVNEHETVIARKMKKLFGDMSKTRPNIIARTETFKAISFATEESYMQSGVVEGKRWATARDKNVCEFCRAMERQTAQIGSSFMSRGSNLTGVDGGTMDLSYETIQNPPLHAGCRCDLFPIIIGQKEYNKVIAKKKKQHIKDEVSKLKNDLEKQKKENKINKEEFDKQVKEIKDNAEKKLNKINDNIALLLNE